MPENPAPSPDVAIWEPTRTDAVVLAIGVVFVGAGALVTLILPGTPGWTFLANFGLTAGVAIALIGVLLRFQLRIESQLERLGKAIDEQAERAGRLEGRSGKPGPAGQYSNTQERYGESSPFVGRQDSVTTEEATTQTKGRLYSLMRTLRKWRDSAYRPPSARRAPREPLFRLPESVVSAIERFFWLIGQLFVIAWGLFLVCTVALVVVITFAFSGAIWSGLLRVAGLWHPPASATFRDGVAVEILAGLTTATAAGLATWHWARLRLPIAIAASMTTLVGLAVLSALDR